MLCPYILTFYCALVSRLNERIRQWNESGRNLLDADSNKPYGCDACVKLFVKLSCVKSTRSSQVRQATIWFQFQVCFLFCFCRPSSTPRPTVSISSHLFYNYTVQFAVQTYWNCSAISMQNPSPHSFVFFAVQNTRSGLTVVKGTVVKGIVSFCLQFASESNCYPCVATGHTIAFINLTFSGLEVF